MGGVLDEANTAKKSLLSELKEKLAVQEAQLGRIRGDTEGVEIEPVGLKTERDELAQIHVGLKKEIEEMDTVVSGVRKEKADLLNVTPDLQKQKSELNHDIEKQSLQLTSLSTNFATIQRQEVAVRSSLKQSIIQMNYLHNSIHSQRRQLLVLQILRVQQREQHMLERNAVTEELDRLEGYRMQTQTNLEELKNVGEEIEELEQKKDDLKEQVCPQMSPLI
jgi:chromosome segregation ATPase